MLAPDLFCRAIDWLTSSVKPGGNLGIRVGQNTFDDLDYAADGALLPSDRTLMTALLQRFDKEAGHLGLHSPRFMIEDYETCNYAIFI